jgi:hypothetical protein
MMPSVRADRHDQTSREDTAIAIRPVLELTPVHRAFSAALSWVPVTRTLRDLPVAPPLTRSRSMCGLEALLIRLGVALLVTPESRNKHLIVVRAFL